MEAIGVIGIILLVFILFICGGVLGWFLEILWHIFDFLFDGCLSTIGCLVWVFLIFCFLCVVFL